MLTPKVILLGGIIAFIALSLVLEENYPISHYPMYSDPDPQSQYYHLTDAEGTPLPVNQLTGVRASNLGKIYRKRMADRASELKVHVKRMSQVDKDHVSRETLAYLRNQAAHHKHKLPERLRIMFTTIRFVDGEVVETSEVIYSE
jgi:hypothetical protein